MVDRFGTPANWALLARMDELSAAHSATVTQVALAWLAAQPGIIAPIASATTVDQLEELLGAARVTLTDDELARLSARWAPRPTRSSTPSSPSTLDPMQRA